MARFVQMQELVRMLRLDLGDDPDVTKGRAPDLLAYRLLNKTQNLLWLTYDWPFKVRDFAVPLIAGQRYYEFPDQMEIEGVQNMYYVESQGNLRELEFDFEDSVYATRTGSQPLFYRLHEPIEGRTSTQIEVWPTPTQTGVVYTDPAANPHKLPVANYETDSIPMDGGGYLLIRGSRKLPPMLRPEDKCYLDGELLVAYAAADLAAKRSSPDANIKMQYATDLNRRLRAAGTERKSMSLTRSIRTGSNPTIRRFIR